jgi:ribosomal protein S12 methylthiotransferase
MSKSVTPIQVGMISLGCAKNLVDAEIMLGALLQSGAEITNDPAQAEVLIVNTCSFIQAAQQEAVDTILEAVELRQTRQPGQALIVSGCLPQRFREDLPKLLPEVDAFMGIDQVTRVGEIVRQALQHRAARKSDPFEKGEHRKGKIAARFAELEKAKAAAPLLQVNARPKFIPDYDTPRYRLTPRHLAYLKIAEGCNHPCSFCIIPQMRGSHRSRAQTDVVLEARQLVADGVKELNLISQDTTYYGMDLRRGAKKQTADGPTLSSLLRELNAIPGDFWIRLLYTHPAHWTDDLIQTIAECPKVARYIDIPLQHIHDNMLERMRRETSRQHIVELLRKIRAGLPGITLRTTFIVGFPGETEACFNDLLDFIRETKFERLGVFTYSREEGTRAGSMAGQLSDKIKQRRRDLAMSAQHEIAIAVSDGYAGRKLKVLVEGEAQAKELQRANVISWEHGLIRNNTAKMPGPKRGKYSVARGEADAPDIDGRIYIAGTLAPGQFATVKIIGHTDYDLIAKPE